MLQKLLSIWKIKFVFPKKFFGFAIEWLIILFVALIYSGNVLLDFDAGMLQQTGEHNESATLPLLAEIGLHRYGEIPLWNPYMLTGFPHVGDFINHFWNPISTLCIVLWGGINGMKVSIFLSLVIAGWGQWMLGYVLGLRRTTRMWSALLFMLSGGVALLWKLGWYELFLGIAWFPWSFASVIYALNARSQKSIALSAVTIALIFTTGGGYYPVYLFVCLAIIMLTTIALSSSSIRREQLTTVAWIALLGATLSAVVLIPYIDGYSFSYREAAPDMEQKASQPIMYALFNYSISEPEWFRSEILGTASGYNWFYLGWLPIASLILLPLVMLKSKRLRRAMIPIALLFIVLLMWHSNRYSPVKYIYDWLPFFYTFRFPGRLLIVASSPLIALAGLTLEYPIRWSSAAVHRMTLSIGNQNGAILKASLNGIIIAAWAIALVYNLSDVYKINKVFAFAPQPLSEKSYETLRWLKHYDPGLYYINMGGGAIYWFWTPAAYDLEMPVINFDYGRRLKSMDMQMSSASPFHASPKYIIASPDQPRPENAQAIREFDGIFVYYDPDALPFAFTTTENLANGFDPLEKSDVQTVIEVKIDGPNRITATVSPNGKDDLLVVLGSDYPGWHLRIDDQEAQVTPVNGYLSAKLIPGKHTYEFYFYPTQYVIGLTISILALILTFVMLAGIKVKLPINLRV